MKRRDFLKGMIALPAVPLLANAEALPGQVISPEPEPAPVTCDTLSYHVGDVAMIDGNLSVYDGTELRELKEAGRILDEKNVPVGNRSILEMWSDRLVDSYKDNWYDEAATKLAERIDNNVLKAIKS